MVLCGFLFDAIAINVVVIGDSIESIDDIALDLAFIEYNYKVTPSRINIAEIPPEKSLLFEANTEEMRENLTQGPLMITLTVTGEAVGNGVLNWPEEVLSACENMSEVTYVDSIDIIAEGEEDGKVGTVDLLIRFKPKCKNLEDDEFGESFAEAKDSILKDVNSKDLFFVIEKKNRLNECNDEMALPADTTPVNNLDMTQLRNYNGLLVPTPNMIRTCCADDCCGMKKTVKKFGAKEQIICGSVNKMKQSKSSGRRGKGSTSTRPGEKLETGQGPKNTCLMCKDGGSSEEEETECEEEEEPLSDVLKKVQWGGKKPPVYCLTTPPPELTYDASVKSRVCTVCNTNVDWLPPFVPCPKCGYKSVPAAAPIAYNTSVQADDILEEYFLRSEPSEPIGHKAFVHQEPEDSDECDCECQKGKTCAHCRVRRACKHLFGKKFDVNDCKNEVPQPALYSEPLQKVFCELKDLLDRTEHLQKQEAFQAEFSQILDKDEKQLKKNLFGGPNNKICKEIETIKERFSRCKPLPSDIPQNKPTCCEKKKKKRGKKCRFPCGLPPNALSTCIPCRKRMIPCKMGWLWTVDPYAKEGWRPGAVKRSIRRLMSFFLKDFPPDTFSIKNPCNRQKPAPKKDCNPVMGVCKRDGILYITLYPDKDKKTCHPLQFKIELSEQEKKMREIRDNLFEQGYSKCTCLKPIAFCNCRPESERKMLENHIMKQACYLGLDDVEDKLILNEEYDSETEYEFHFYGTSNEEDRKRKKKKMHTAGSGPSAFEDDGAGGGAGAGAGGIC